MTESNDQGPQQIPQPFLSLFQQYEESIQHGQMDDAETVLIQVMSHIGEQVSTNPTPDMLLLGEAGCCEQKADWEGAKAAYRKLQETGVKSGDMGAQFSGHIALSQLYRLLREDQSAIEQARSAAAVARRMDFAMLLARALELEARCCLRLDLISHALSALAEALEELGTEPVNDIPRGRCLIERANCLVANGDYSRAMQDLQEGWRLLEPKSAMYIAAGVHASLAAWWSVTAEIRTRQGDSLGAEEARAAAVSRWRHVAALPQVSGPYTQSELADALQSYAQTLVASAKHNEAEEALAESRQIRTAIGLS